MSTATVFSDNGRTYQVVNTGEEVIVSQVFIPSPPIIPKGMHHDYLKHRNVDIAKQYDGGKTIKELAKEYGLIERTIVLVLRDEGQTIPSASEKIKIRNQKIVLLQEAGFSQTTIAERFDLTPARISQIVSAHKSLDTTE